MVQRLSSKAESSPIVFSADPQSVSAKKPSLRFVQPSTALFWSAWPRGAVLGAAYVLAGVPHPILFGFATGLLATVPFGAPLIFVIACFTLIIQSRITAAV